MSSIEIDVVTRRSACPPIKGRSAPLYARGPMIYVVPRHLPDSANRLRIYSGLAECVVICHHCLFTDISAFYCVKVFGCLFIYLFSNKQSLISTVLFENRIAIMFSDPDYVISGSCYDPRDGQIFV